MMTQQPNLISVILPCYNERENISLLVTMIHEELAAYNHEIVVVDDNSPDGTYRFLVESADPFVVPVLRTTNRGLANSIREGIEKSKGNIIVVMDSDFNHQPKYLSLMVDNIRYYNCVSASRFQYGGMMHPRSRHILSWIFNIYTRIMTGGMVTDSLYGYFAIKRETIFNLNFDKIFWGYGDYCIRLFYYLQKNKISILQFPAVNGRRLAGEGNSRFLKVFRQYAIEVLKLTFNK